MQGGPKKERTQENKELKCYKNISLSSQSSYIFRTFITMLLKKEICVLLKARTNLTDAKWQFKHFPLNNLGD